MLHFSMLLMHVATWIACDYMRRMIVRVAVFIIGCFFMVMALLSYNDVNVLNFCGGFFIGAVFVAMGVSGRFWFLGKNVKDI